MCLSSTRWRSARVTPPRVCRGHPEFTGWERGIHDQRLNLPEYVKLFYNAVVTLAVVADRMMTAGLHPSNWTEEDWLQGMRELYTAGVVIDGFSGRISL